MIVRPRRSSKTMFSPFLSAIRSTISRASSPVSIVVCFVCSVIVPHSTRIKLRSCLHGVSLWSSPWRCGARTRNRRGFGRLPLHPFQLLPHVLPVGAGPVYAAALPAHGKLVLRAGHVGRHPVAHG